MKKLISVLVSGLMAVSLAACSSTPSVKEETGIYTPGTYTAEAEGFGGTVTVTLTVDANSITDAVLEGAGETPSVGGAALETLAQQLKDANSAEIDGVSGATVTSGAVKAAAAKALAEAKGEEASAEKAPVADGKYTAEVASYAWTGLMTVETTITDGKIAEVKVVEEHDSETGEVSGPAFALLPGRIVEAQSVAVDAVAGATVTSNAIKSAVTSAIEQAGGSAAEWLTPVEKKTDTVTLEGYDVIVVGLGHGGCEAAALCARLGFKTLGVTLDLKKIGLMSCNPAVGGPGKGQLVRELDAMGGIMGKITDSTGTHFRRLNESKGPAVRARRALVDRLLYAQRMQEALQAIPNLYLLEGEAENLLSDGRKVIGVSVKGVEYLSKATILTTGTFLNGLLHFGMRHFAGGRVDDVASTGLSPALSRLGLKLGRFKTGTPARFLVRNSSVTSPAVIISLSFCARPRLVSLSVYIA